MASDSGKGDAITSFDREIGIGIPANPTLKVFMVVPSDVPQERWTAAHAIK